MSTSISDLLESGRRPLIIAHRGASFYFRENTREAFEAAVDMRAEMIELDVRRTADGVLVVHHNFDFAGCEIKALSKKKLEELESEAGYKVHALEDILKFCAGKILMDIELKEAGYEEQVLEAVLGVLEPDTFVVTSFLDAAVRKIREVEPEVRTGLILGGKPRWRLVRNMFPGRRARRAGVSFLAASWELVSLGFLKTTKNLGLPVWVYTVNDRRELWKYISDERIAGIFSDRPDVALFLRDLNLVQSGKVSQEKGE